MFDFDRAIAQWRREMLEAGIISPIPLEELENHLREDVEGQMRAGLSAEKAFEIGAARLGQAGALKGEFNKTKRSDMINHNRIYSATLAGFTVCNAVTTALILYWLAYVGGPLGHLHPRAMPWVAALACVYELAMIATLLARWLRPRSGRRLTRALNWALLAGFPCGTVLGSYGLWKVDKKITAQI